MDIAYWLQHAEDRVILQAFRGVGKSYITVAFVLWTLLLDPQKKIMVVSANEDAAKAFTTFARQLIDGMEILHHLRPVQGQRDSVESFDVGPSAPSKNPSLKSVGITGQLTGSRADIIVPDDIEIPKNTLTHHQRTLLAERVKEFGAVLKPGGRVIYLGTPQVEETVYLKLQEERREYSFVQQFTRMWRQKDALPREDRLEAVAGACAYFVEMMAQAGGERFIMAHRIIDSYRRRALGEMLDKFPRCRS